ncbi:hypothetical protein O3G_MSEX001610 [Manduca sexta]|uniref:Uncharacterized protein n=1 Tax=Manduca sexta TaxID=7130 RepID=A0A922CCQ0_MANSE|nr:hypothetical protein O3G_MSEX001610 [Manduca sexta]
MKTPILVSIFLITLWCGVDARCRYRGQCITIGGHAKPCPVDIEAQPLVEGLSIEESEEIVNILANRCPVFVYDDEGNRKPNNEILTCCDHLQIRKMTEDLSLAETVLGRCPSCFRNFARHVCEMNCSPEQSRFVDVYTETAADSTIYVNEIDYRLHESFMLGAHSACSGVIIPQTGLPAINMMCGNAVVCDAEAWFGFMGDTSQNPLAPVQVNFLKWPTEEDSMHERAIRCNETTGSDLPCSCVDCAEMCPIGTEPVIPEICTVLNVNCISFSVGITFFVISVTIFILLTLSEYRRMRNGQVKSAEPTDVSKFIKFFQVLFAKIGGFSASHPAIIIMFMTWIIFGMFFGAVSLNLTSNPIELWSGPESRSRQELNYFNSRFGPFYRAAQVFMQFNGLESFEVDNTTYGPAFRIEAVRELVELEQAIINIGREDGGVTLEEVCFAPLRPRGGEKRLDQCVSMSVSVYLGEDIDNINENTYLGRIQNCLNNYLALNCQASWGGGAEPLISLGGFDGDDVLGADTLLINFPIANFMLEEDLVPVLEWEQKFIDLMHDYVANKKPDFVDISFGAERSIEDEIRRITTVVSILSLDYKRASQNRLDVFCCVQKKILDDEDPLNSDTPYQSVTQRLMEPYSKFILNWKDEPSPSCNRGGLASYSGSVNYELDSEGRATVYDTNFMAYHIALSTSQDFISAVKNAYEISDSITAAIKKHTDMDVEVFPYSVFYVYFAQYLTMWGDTFSSLGYCLIGALVINLLASGFNILTTFAVIFTAIMIVINMMGVMYIWNIPLNPVSCVNLIVSIGIAVEFCSHIAYAFATSKRPSSERVEDAIRKVGSTIITGITLTNIPIVVLAFSYTEVIEVFFFRMFFSLVILGFLHGMIFFPVLLSYLNNLKNK